MRCRHGVHVVRLAAGCRSTMELPAIPGSVALDPIGTPRGVRNIALSGNDIRTVGTACQGFDPRRGVGNGMKVGRGVGMRAILAIVAAPDPVRVIPGLVGAAA